MDSSDQDQVITVAPSLGQNRANPTFAQLREVLHPLFIIACRDNDEPINIILNISIALRRVEAIVEDTQFPIDWMYVIIIAETIMDEATLRIWRTTEPEPTISQLHTFLLDRIRQISEQSAADHMAQNDGTSYI